MSVMGILSILPTKRIPTCLFWKLSKDKFALSLFPNMLALKINYDNSIRPAWKFKESFTEEVESINYNTSIDWWRYGLAVSGWYGWTVSIK